MIKNNLKIYLVVYGCEPNQGGEHEVGWKVANELVKQCDLTVITRRANKVLINKFNKNGINFLFLENDFFLKFKPKGKFSYFYYLFWQLSVFLYLNNRTKKDDIVHYLTFGNIHLPHFLFLLKAKLIIGPMGGGSVIDTRLMTKPKLTYGLRSISYDILNWTVRINPVYYILFYRCSRIILRTEETLKIIPKSFHEKCLVHLETGVDISLINVLKKERKLKKIITTGRLIPTKNIDQVIEVYKELLEIRKQSLQLTIVGDGPLIFFLENKYSELKGLNFLGKVTKKDVNNLLKTADLFLFCSIKEGGSHSLFEAAMNNIPIACYNVSGMKVFPKDDSAIKIIPTSNIKSNVINLAQKIDESFRNQNEINSKCSRAILDLKTNYDWEKIGARFVEIYNEI